MIAQGTRVAVLVAFASYSFKCKKSFVKNGMLPIVSGNSFSVLGMQCSKNGRESKKKLLIYLQNYQRTECIISKLLKNNKLGCVIMDESKKKLLLEAKRALCDIVNNENNTCLYVFNKSKGSIALPKISIDDDHCNFTKVLEKM